MTASTTDHQRESHRGWVAANGLDRYRSMVTIRRFEEIVTEMRIAEQVVGSVHLCIGQESGPVALSAVKLERDRVLSTYRGHGWAIACGVPVESLFAEMLGRATGTNGGRGGSAMLSSPEHGFLGENSIVGAAAPIACGVGLAQRYTGADRVVFCVFGDGAMNQGAVTEAFNFAGAFKVPVVFICENNGWSELTAIDSMVADPELYRRGSVYGLSSSRVDGNDLQSLEVALADAAERARSASEPSLIEVMTQRLVGHYIGDAQQYRRPGELDHAVEVEAIARLRRELIEVGVTEIQLDDVAREVDAELAAAKEAALAAPLADASTVREHVYV